MRISFSSPFVVVDAIQNSGEHAVPVPEETVEARAEILGHNLAGVTWAYRRDRIRISDAGLQAIHLAVELHARGIEVIPGQIHQRIMAGGENPLIGQIMKREADPGAGAPAREFF